MNRVGLSSSSESIFASVFRSLRTIQMLDKLTVCVRECEREIISNNNRLQRVEALR